MYNVKPFVEYTSTQPLDKVNVESFNSSDIKNIDLIFSFHSTDGLIARVYGWGCRPIWTFSFQKTGFFFRQASFVQITVLQTSTIIKKSKIYKKKL